MMDPLTECPICFEDYAPEGRHEQWVAPCCGQMLCAHCSSALRKCPFCRSSWHEAEDGGHPWLRRSFRNPVLVLLGAGAVNEVLASQAVRGAVTAGLAVVAETSPAVIATGVIGAAVVVGGVALHTASQHSPAQAERLLASIRSREQRYLNVPWTMVARRLFESLQCHLSPQKVGMPHVYHGSVWRSEAREQHLSQLQALCSASPSDVNDRSQSQQTYLEQLWTELVFIFELWLHYNPHTANWGTCSSYGLPPMHFCWHNNWRVDLRHAASALARRITSDPRFRSLEATKEARSCLCLLGTLDFVLSWNVFSPVNGHSDLVAADFCIYRNFCLNLSERFAFGWAAAQAPLDADVGLERFDGHVEAMSLREIPDEFLRIW